jgi:hypothetical protein
MYCRLNNCLCVLILSLLVPTGYIVADEKHGPSLELLQSLVGRYVGSKPVRSLIEDYGFRRIPQRPKSWSSTFGITLTADADDLLEVRLRPSADSKNVRSYAGPLPSGLKAEQTIEEIKRVLGEPIEASGEMDGEFILMYKNLSVVTQRGTLFEIWLTDAEPPKKRK